jgi:hypothetical protein
MTRSRIDLHLGLLGAALIACAFAFSAWGTPPLPPALSVVFGIPSPLTGMTRSFVALAQGDVVRAFAFHPLGPLSALACAVAVVSCAQVIATGRRPRVVERLLSVPAWGWIVGATFLIVWIRQIVVYR